MTFAGLLTQNQLLGNPNAASGPAIPTSSLPAFTFGTVTVAATGNNLTALILNQNTAASEIGITFQQSGVAEWSFYKESNNTLFVYDRVNSTILMGFQQGSSTAAYVTIQSTTVSSSATTGALVVSGGVGIAGAVFVGGNISTVQSYVSLSATATTAGGATAPALKMGTAGLGVYFGSGLPTISAPQGSLYLRTDGSSTSTRLYVNTNGTTGWTNAVTAA